MTGMSMFCGEHPPVEKVHREEVADQPESDSQGLHCKVQAERKDSKIVFSDARVGIRVPSARAKKAQENI